jgi:hypothetical protein
VLRTTRRHLRDNFVAYIALCVALGGTGAFAATSMVAPDGKLNGCVTKKGKGKGTLRVVASGRRCRRSERAIAWNQRGPQGSPDTSAQVLAKLEQVDGTGSALDADLLDGHDTSFFQPRGLSTACTGTDKVTGLGATGDVTCAGDNTTPSGTAGGHLAGSYPNPTLAPFPQITLFGTSNCPFDFTQDIPNNVETSLYFGHEASGFWPPTAASGNCQFGKQVIETPRTGTYLISAGMLWPANATGQRGLAIDIDGEGYASQRDAAAAVGDTHTNVTTLLRLTSGVLIRAKAFQSSGGTLTLNAADDHRQFLSAIWLGPH